MTDSRFTEANFRMAKLTQVSFAESDCARADFGAAQLDTVRFPSSDLSGADLDHAKCANVDFRTARLDGLRGAGSLRGATIGIEQLYGLAPGLAAAVGLRVLADDENDEPGIS